MASLTAIAAAQASGHWPMPIVAVWASLNGDAGHYAARLAGHRQGRSATLQSVSEALLENVDGAECGFFQLFGPPPYWTTAEADDLDDEADADTVPGNDE